MSHRLRLHARPGLPLLVRDPSVGAPVRVITLVEPGTGHCSHLVACEQTWTAAIVDPVPGIAEPLHGLLDERSLRLRLVLRTRSTDSNTVASQRYRSLMSTLGMTASAEPVGQRAGLPWRDLPETGPTSEQEQDSDDLQVWAGQVTVRLSMTDQGGPQVTVGGCGGRPPEGARVRGLRAALGPFHIHALPLPDRQGLAWMVADRLFTGTHLRGGTASGTPSGFLHLPPETLVYPGRLTRGRSISTVGQERACADPRQSRTELRSGRPRRLRLHAGA